MTVATLAQILPYFFGPLQITSVILAGRGKISAWVILATVQLGIVAFGFMAGYWGFAMNLLMAGAAMYNFVLWRHKSRQKAAEVIDNG